MTSDPWAGVTPIGEKKAAPRPHPPTRYERAEPPPADPGVPPPGGPPPDELPVTMEELLEKSTQLLRKFHGDALNPDKKAYERENFGRTFGVLVDRVKSLIERPPTSATDALSDPQRRALTRLARSIAERSDAPSETP